MDGEKLRDLRPRLTDEEWGELQKIKYAVGCNTWTEFFRLLLRHRREVEQVLTSLPP